MPLLRDLGAREILDSRGNPTLEGWVVLEDGTRAVAGVPSGASTGAHEAHELRDGDMQRFLGLGVLQAVNNVNGEIRSALMGMEATRQAALDARLCELDGTPNKTRLGANALLAVSLATARAAALSQGLPLYRHLAQLADDTSVHSFPIPMFNVVNGGKHSDSGLSVQEFKLIPAGIENYAEQLRAGSEIFHALQKLLAKAGETTGVGDEGGFAPHLESHVRALEIIRSAVQDAGYRFGEEVFLGLDVAANSFYSPEEEVYLLKPEGVRLSRDALINLYREWIRDFAIISIEDGLHEEDFTGWALMREKLEQTKTARNTPCLLIGDDLLVTNVARLEQAIAAKACNAALIKVNQIGTLSETLACMRLARTNHMARVISHRSGETVDDFIADLAVGAGAEYIKTGSLSRGERLAKYNRLLAIDRELNQVD